MSTAGDRGKTLKKKENKINSTWEKCETSMLKKRKI
jgi:hypothetical protein